MKSKILYAVLAALVLVLLVGIWSTRKSEKAQTGSEEVISQATTAQQAGAPLDMTQQSRAPFAQQSGITVINPREKVNSPSVSARENATDFQKKSSSPRQLSGVSGRQLQASSGVSGSPEPDPGITKIGHRPTEKEKKEMEAQGVVLY